MTPTAKIAAAALLALACSGAYAKAVKPAPDAEDSPFGPFRAVSASKAPSAPAQEELAVAPVQADAPTRLSGPYWTLSSPYYETARATKLSAKAWIRWPQAVRVQGTDADGWSFAYAGEDRLAAGFSEASDPKAAVAARSAAWIALCDGDAYSTEPMELPDGAWAVQSTCDRREIQAESAGARTLSARFVFRSAEAYVMPKLPPAPKEFSEIARRMLRDLPAFGVEAIASTAAYPDRDAQAEARAAGLSQNLAENSGFGAKPRR